eukprot:CCRYP_012145-RA/>CCRYP_012145-RA protein AED:0.10 eAED:0.10 QI:0/-1/0/1/-1/1/1/0/625
MNQEMAQTMADELGIWHFRAPMVSPAGTDETEARCNIEREEGVRNVRDMNSKTSVAYSRLSEEGNIDHGSSNQEYEAQMIVEESRDEKATKAHGRRDDEQIHEENSSDTILHVLEKSTTLAGPNESHTSSKTRQQNAKITQSKFNLGFAIDEFLRVHNCEPLLESDDESESCYSRSMDSVASRRRSRRPSLKDRQNSAVKSPVREVQDEVRPVRGKNEKDEDPLELQIKTLRRELDASRETISALETQLSSNITSPTQITQLVSQKREIEELAVDKSVLEKQLKLMQQQLVDAKQDATNAAAAIQRLEHDNKKLEEALLEMKSTEEVLKEKLANVGSTEESPIGWAQVQHMKKSDSDSVTIQQLRLDLNEAHSVIKRLEKDRLRERKHYHRLMEGSASNRAGLELRIEQEMETNHEMMRKCYVLEQKLNDKKKAVKDLESELNRAWDEVAVKNRECESLLSQIDHFKRTFRDGERQMVELGCMQDINECLNNELASSIKENKRLKEELRRLKKFSSYRVYENLSLHPSKASEKSKQSTTQESYHSRDDDRKGKSDTENIQMDDKNVVFVKALRYLGETEDAPRTSTPEAQTNATPCDHERSTMQQARNRFERLRSEFLNSKNSGQ